jgi:glycosyltransferase involved in cell wall biosynthesis
MRSNPVLSLVFPVWNEQEVLRELYTQVTAACASTGATYELVFVDNGSRDASLAIIKDLARQDPRVRFVSLSRNFGHQGGLFAGLSAARGDAVISMDADLQHPPSMIPQMVELWRSGYEVVYTTKRSHVLKGLRRMQVRLFYWMLSKLSGLQLSFGQSDFRLLDRRVVDVLLSIPDTRKFLRGTVQWLGFSQVGVEYDVVPRRAGESKFSYWSLFSFALDGMVAFSTMPLRWIAILGAVTAVLSLAYTIVAVVTGVLELLGLTVRVPPGWATVAAAVTFLGGVQLLSIGIVGEYIGRIYEQTKGRPTFVVRETSDAASDRGSETAASDLHLRA